MSSDRVYLFDTTLRDGAQTTGVDFSLADKIQITTMLDTLGIDYIEGGYPGANPLDTEFFSKKRTKSARFTAFGMTKKIGRSASNDPGIAALLDSKSDAICYVGKAWDYQVRVALEASLEDNLDSVRDSVATAVKAGRETMLDCEHFFDGYKANPDYALSVAKAAYDAGARWVVLCDTNGGTLPHEIQHIVGEVIKLIPGNHLGIHAHDDTGNAVANSFAAIRAGAANPAFLGGILDHLLADESLLLVFAEDQQVRRHIVESAHVPGAESKSGDGLIEYQHCAVLSGQLSRRVQVLPGARQQPSAAGGAGGGNSMQKMLHLRRT